MEEEKEGEKREIVSSGERGLSKAASGLVIRGLDLAKDVDLSYNPERLKEHFTRALELFLEKKYEDAEGEICQFISYADIGLIKDRAMVHVARYFLGDCLNKQGKYNEAEMVTRKNIELGIDGDDTRYLLGQIILNQLRLSEAEVEFRLALRMNPNSHKAHGGLGMVLFKQKKYEEAEKACRRAVQLEPDDPGAHANLADVLSEMGRHKEAIKEMREAIRLKPKDAEVRVNYAAMLFYRGDFKGAVKVLKEAIIIDPNCTSALFVLAGSLDKKEKRREARQYWERLSKLKVQPDWVGLIKHRLSEPD